MILSSVLSLVLAVANSNLNSGGQTGKQNNVKRFDSVTKVVKGKSKTKKRNYAESCPLQPEKIVTPGKGGLTFEAEGKEANNRFYSRILHVPSDTSGLTLGRGYDMKTKSPKQIEEELSAAGIEADHAKKLSSAAKLKGDDARNFIKEKNLDKFCLTPEQQTKLYAITYAGEEKEAKRLYNKWNSDDPEMPQWEDLDSDTQAILVDLKYRGDYLKYRNAFLKEAIKSNDRTKLQQAVSDEEVWKTVQKQAPDRFKQRIKFLD